RDRPIAALARVRRAVAEHDEDARAFEAHKLVIHRRNGRDVSAVDKGLNEHLVEAHDLTRGFLPREPHVRERFIDYRQPAAMRADERRRGRIHRVEYATGRVEEL